MGRRWAVALASSVGLCAVLAGCGGASTATTLSGAPAGAASGPVGGEGLVGPAWQLSSAAIDSVDLSAFGITLAFTDTGLRGSSGVNTYAGSYSASSDGVMEIGPVVSTEMAGPDDAMRAESAYLALLATVTGYTSTATELDLFAGQQEVLVFAAG